MKGDARTVLCDSGLNGTWGICVAFDCPGTCCQVAEASELVPLLCLSACLYVCMSMFVCVPFVCPPQCSRKRCAATVWCQW